MNKKVISKDIIVIKTSSDKYKILKDIAEKILKIKLAACVNLISNVDSIYEWNGKVVKEKEIIMLIKTIKNNETEIYNTIISMHNYEVPEILTFNTYNVGKDYADWLIKVVKYA